MRLIDADEIRIKPEYIYYGVCGTPVIRCEDLARIINDMPTVVEFDGEINKVIVKGVEYVPISERKEK